MESGVARKPIEDWAAYEAKLYSRLNADDNILRSVISKARSAPKRVVFAEAENLKILKAAQIVQDEGIAIPILLGNEAQIQKLISEHGLQLRNISIIDPRSETQAAARQEYGERYFALRHRRGVNHYEAHKLMRERVYFGCMMVETGEADALVSGLTRNYPDMLRPALEIIGLQDGARRMSGMYLMLTRKGPLFFADTTVNFEPTEDDLVDITVQTARAVEQLGITPRVALLSYSNFGSSSGEEALRVRGAVSRLRQQYPDLVVDGEMQAGLAFDQELLAENYPFTELANGAPNVLIFPNLAAGNIAYHLLQEVGGVDAIGPISVGLRKAVQVLQLGSSVRQIVNLVALTVVDAQVKSDKHF
jgi:malate dehydrogenase (oxaloacetate-decarboxylating)(NADP+)